MQAWVTSTVKKNPACGLKGHCQSKLHVESPDRERLTTAKSRQPPESTVASPA